MRGETRCQTILACPVQQSIMTAIYVFGYISRSPQNLISGSLDPFTSQELPEDEDMTRGYHGLYHGPSLASYNSAHSTPSTITIYINPHPPLDPAGSSLHYCYYYLLSLFTRWYLSVLILTFFPSFLLLPHLISYHITLPYLTLPSICRT